MVRLLLPLLAIIGTLSTMSTAMAQKTSPYSVLSLSVPLSAVVFPSIVFASNAGDKLEEEVDYDDDDDDLDDDDDDDFDDDDNLETAGEL